METQYSSTGKVMSEGDGDSATMGDGDSECC